MTDSERVYEQLSGLMDGELSSGEAEFLLRRLSSEPGLRARWERYHLVRDAVRQELPAYNRVNVADRVAAALEDDPGDQTYARRAGLTFIKTAASVAVAAVVAIGALSGVGLVMEDGGPRSVQVVGTDSGGRSGPQLAQAEAGGGEAGADMVRAYVDLPRTRWSLDEPAMENQLNSYLVNHNEHAAGTGMRGLMPYMRIAGYDSSER